MGLINEIHSEQEKKVVVDQYIKMDRVYLRPWHSFRAQTEQLLPYMKQLVEKDKNSLNNQIQGILAFAAAGFDSPKLRKELVSNSLRLLGNKKVSQATAKGGLMGLALSSTQDAKSQELAKKLAKQIKPHTFEFAEQIDILWSLCALQLYNEPVVQELLSIFEIFEFERVQHEIKYEELIKLMDIMNALKLESGLTLKNKTLQDIFVTKETVLSTYREHSQVFDPIKKRVMSALAQGLGQASISHKFIMEEELMNQQLADQLAMNPDKYPYKPDMMLGYKGKKVAMFVLQENDATRDTYEPNGALRFRMRLLEKAHNGELKAAAIAVNNVINHDLEKMKISINNKFNFQKVLEERINEDDSLVEQHDIS